MVDVLTSQFARLPMRHEQPEFIPHARVLLRGCKVAETDPGFLELDSLSEGPVVGWHLLESEDQAKVPRVWVQACGVTAEASGWSPRGAGWASPQPGLQVARGQSPLGLTLPDGYPATMVSGLDFDSPVQLAAPAWAGLVCPTKGGSLPLASAVWDCAGTRLDQGRYAPITSAWALYNRPLAGPWGAADPARYMGIAWQLGVSATPADPLGGVGGLGMVIEAGFGKEVLAAASVVVGGPLNVGNNGDIHKLDSDSKHGTPINALHLSTQSIWIRPNGSGDATLEDGGAYRNCVGGPWVVEAYWRFDAEARHDWALGSGPGQWRWQSAAYIALPPLLPPPQEPRPAIPQPIVPAGNPVGPKTVIAKNLELSSFLETNRPLPRSIGEIGLRGLVLMESADWPAVAAGEATRDDRNRVTELDADGVEAWRNAGALMRMDVAIDPDSVPTTEQRYSRVGAGVAWLLPAELGLEDAWRAANQGQSPEVDYTEVGKRWLGFGRGVNLFFGAPANDRPWAPGQGFGLEFVPAGTSLKMTTYTAGGSGTDILTLLSGGALSLLASVTAPIIYGNNVVDTDMLNLSSKAKSLALEQKAGTWSTNRVQEFQDADGTVALLESDQEFIGDLKLSGALEHTGSTVGFLGATPSAQGSPISAPTGGATIDTEARAAINSIRAVLAGFGFIGS